MRGGDKLQEPVDGMPLLRNRVQTVALVSRSVLVALAPPDTPRDAALHAMVADLHATPLTCPDAAEGLSGTLRNAVAQLPHCERFMVLPADLPEITADDLATILRSAEGDADHLIWQGATIDGKAGHPILFDAVLRLDFATLTGDTGGKDVLRAHAQHLRLVALPDDHARCDLDTPEDWTAWRRKTGL